MAEDVVTFFLNKLSFLITEEARLLGGVDEQVRLLHDELEFIKSFLRDADKKRETSETVKTWVRQIRDLAFDAEDVIDFLMLKTKQQQQRNIGLRFICYHRKVITLHKLGKKIEVINRRIEKISSNKSKYDATSTLVETSSHSNQGKRRPPIDEELDVDVVGFEAEAKDLSKLLKEEAGQQVPLVSIVGMGGLGKTTLAKKIFNDVKKNFDCCAFVYVSQEYSITDIFQKIIKQVKTFTKERRESEKGEEEELSVLGKIPKEQLKENLSKLLEQKKYLIVFDDVWKETDWDELKKYLPYRDQNKQSKVLLSTRCEKVAKHASSKFHKLRFLEEDEGLDLLLRKASVKRQECSIELEKLGKNMVAKCGRLPLAIVTLGGLLSTKEVNDEEWKRVKE